MEDLVARDRDAPDGGDAEMIIGRGAADADLKLTVLKAGAVGIRDSYIRIQPHRARIRR